MENKRIIQVDEKVPFKMLVPLSIQHCLRCSVLQYLCHLYLELIRQLYYS